MENGCFKIGLNFCNVSTLKDKQVAVNITLLPEGTVIFDDVSSVIYNGTIKILSGQYCWNYEIIFKPAGSARS